MTKGPLAVRWGDWTLDDPQAGAVTVARVELENAGTVAWRESVLLSYHWLDLRGNPIVWDGERTGLPLVEPGERISAEAHVRAPIPPGRYRFALDLVVERRVWFSLLGSELAWAEVEVLPREGSWHAERPGWVEPSSDWQERVDAAHTEGFAVVAGSFDWAGGVAHRRPKALEPYLVGTGRIPGFSHPLVCPSVLDGVELEPLPDVAGLPAFAPPTEEPWIYDGRIVLRARPRSAG
jgi:hypothetical protein